LGGRETGEEGGGGMLEGYLECRRKSMTLNFSYLQK
jgi:hypothetical protein